MSYSKFNGGTAHHSLFWLRAWRTASFTKSTFRQIARIREHCLIWYQNNGFISFVRKFEKSTRAIDFCRGRQLITYCFVRNLYKFKRIYIFIIYQYCNDIAIEITGSPRDVFYLDLWCKLTVNYNNVQQEEPKASYSTPRHMI